MKYFTPELYLKFNSSDDNMVDQAHEEWEQAIIAYQAHLKEIAGKLTSSTYRIAKSLCLHDAQFLGLMGSLLWSDDDPLAVLKTRQEAKSVVLIYCLAEVPIIQEAKVPWPYSKESMYWLYDEFSVDKEGIQQHDVLFSNGRIVTLKFHELQLFEFAAHSKTAVA